jgi:hypothetical protein
MKFKVLGATTNRVLLRSQVHPADDPKRPNLRLTNLFDGEPPSRIFVRSKSDPDNDKDFPNLDSDTGEVEQDVTPSMVYIDTSDLIGKTFLLDQQEAGTTSERRPAEENDSCEAAPISTKLFCRLINNHNDFHHG